MELLPKPQGFKPVRDYPKDHIHFGKPRCQAWSSRKGRQCMGLAMPSGKCRVHGGSSLKGIASPKLVTGKYSKYLPNRLLDTYTEALEDTDLITLRNEIALLESRLVDLLSRIDSGESGNIWNALQDKTNKMLSAIRSSDADKQRIILSDITNLILRGNSDYTIWKEIQDILDQIRKLKESERRRLIDAQQMITAEQALLHSKALGAAVRVEALALANRDRNFDATDFLQRIQTRFTQLMYRDNIG